MARRAGVWRKSFTQSRPDITLASTAARAFALVRSTVSKMLSVNSRSLSFMPIPGQEYLLILL